MLIYWVRHEFFDIFKFAAIPLIWILLPNHEREKIRTRQRQKRKTPKKVIFSSFWTTFLGPKWAPWTWSARLCTGQSRCGYKEKREGETKREIETQRELVMAQKCTQIMGQARLCLSLHLVSLWRISGWRIGAFKRIWRIFYFKAFLALFGDVELPNQAWSRATAWRTILFTWHIPKWHNFGVFYIFCDVKKFVTHTVQAWPDQWAHGLEGYLSCCYIMSLSFFFRFIREIRCRPSGRWQIWP